MSGCGTGLEARGCSTERAEARWSDSGSVLAATQGELDQERAEADQHKACSQQAVTALAFPQSHLGEGGSTTPTPL